MPFRWLLLSMVVVGPGLYHPLYPATEGEKEIPVAQFLLDRFPVTNGQFLRFVEKFPRWRRHQVTRLFADKQYLAHWKSPLRLGPAVDPKQPVTYVSWFAAKAYCESLGKRLPLEQEWELAAAASEGQPDGKNDPIFRQRILTWYSKPAGASLSKIGRSPPNYWGIFDLHGLIWEWVLDFNASLASGDAREQGEGEKLRFCGAGALTAKEKENYAEFMRIAFRSSLEAQYAVSSLGFRCAAELKDGY